MHMNTFTIITVLFVVYINLNPLLISHGKTHQYAQTSVGGGVIGIQNDPEYVKLAPKLAPNETKYNKVQTYWIQQRKQCYITREIKFFMQEEKTRKQSVVFSIPASVVSTKYLKVA